MSEIVEKLVPQGSRNRPGGNYPKSTVTIHETGNTAPSAGAYNHALFAATREDKVSVHYYVDDTITYRTIPDHEASNHSGDTEGNRYSISIEICVNSTSNFSVACDRAAALAAQLLHTRGLDSSALRQHFDWNGKNCPMNLRKAGWGAFVKKVQREIDAFEDKPTLSVLDNVPSAWAVAAVDWAKKNKLIVGDKSGNLKLHQPLDTERFLTFLYRYHQLNNK